jgi:hypothetical protein
MRRFVLIRDRDVSNVSGEGVVVWGVEFPDGYVAYRWNTNTATTCLAVSIDDVNTIHGHDGATRVVWLDTVEGAQLWRLLEPVPAPPGEVLSLGGAGLGGAP